MNSRGFTLIEILIALAILSLSMLGIYRLTFVSLNASEYSVRKAYVNEAGYLRVLEQLNYPGRNFNETKAMPDGTKIKFTVESGAALYSGVDEIKLTCEAKDAKSVYYYYEAQ
ncbi:prepilin-type N-terminal cleavage/methylation domain-containing protein [Seleniivibrio sp.]|uniref:PulJ/GspJ family protein n=1 Tax=Seleniivibrio sp. TaxID=2898801 RepID=UPI0025CF46B0|nr:prepilin-type N-terminal cleavage/methylation domain-containing protein [Seleniivibrio sp.]MCD8554928.1 prepilin-type N-terminal cleavage/methylation domain-containing protein [Seleniivibrio sp.]